MKNFKNKENKIYSFEDNCFDEQGNVINEIVKVIIEKEELIAIIELEYQSIIAEINAVNVESQKQAQELEKSQKLTEFYEIATELELI